MLISLCHILTLSKMVVNSLLAGTDHFGVFKNRKILTFFFTINLLMRKNTIRGAEWDERLTCINKKFIFYKKVSNN